MTTLPTRSQASQPDPRPQRGRAVPVAMSSAAATKGKASPSLRPGLRGQREADVVLLVDRLGLLLVDRAALALATSSTPAALPPRRRRQIRRRQTPAPSALSRPASLPSTSPSPWPSALGSAGPTCGPPTCTSPASTGSVGASAAPSSSAAAGASPRPQPSSDDPGDRQRHTDREQPPRRRPPRPARAVAQAQRPVDGEPHAHQRDEHGELGDAVDLGADLQRVEARAPRAAAAGPPPRRRRGAPWRPRPHSARGAPGAPPRAAGRCRE